MALKDEESALVALAQRSEASCYVLKRWNRKFERNVEPNLHKCVRSYFVSRMQFEQIRLKTHLQEINQILEEINAEVKTLLLSHRDGFKEYYMMLNK